MSKPELYEIRWHGRGRTLMSRNYCKDRKSVQKYIDRTFERLKDNSAYSVQTRGSSSDYFETIDRNDYNSGISIRKVDEAKEPYNVLVDKFDDLHFLYSSTFRSILSNEELSEFVKQELQDKAENNMLYSCL